jgi:NAD(P)-dependent dehydrogenase (short-subunit alcohol dehydrogenase family)
MIAQRFKGKIVLVTGAAQGMGKEIALMFINEGAKVALLDNNYDSLEKTFKKVEKNKIMLLGTDISIKQEVDESFDKIIDKWDKIDILINNAGVLYPTNIEDITENEWDKVMDVNVKGYFLCSQRAYKEMKQYKKGIIVNNASTAGIRTSTLGGLHYTTSKTALLGLTRHFAREAGKYNIRVNAICPGIINTEMVQKHRTAQQIDIISNKLPLGRIGRPTEVANLVAFLASEESSYITGSFINICGGELTLP